jgi:hypothetical protein
MFSLEEIYKTVQAARDDAQRTPINPADLPLTISKPGSYYLTGDANIKADASAITVTANNVTIDLNGFTLEGPGKDFATANGAAAITYNANDLAVVNGTMTEWPSGGLRRLGSGVRGVALDLRIANTGGYAIFLLNGSLVANCQIYSNSGSTAVRLFDGSQVYNTLVAYSGVDNTSNAFHIEDSSVVENCVAFQNEGDGFQIQDGATIRNSVARQNGGYGIEAAGSAVLIEGCSATDNTASGIFATSGARISGTISYSNGGNGIALGSAAGFSIDGCTIYANRLDGINGPSASRGRVTNCNVTGNYYDGIDLGGSNYVVGNSSTTNGTLNTVSDGTGIRVASGFVKENFCANNDIGVASSGAYFSQNALRGNTTNESIAGSTEGTGELANIIF